MTAIGFTLALAVIAFIPLDDRPVTSQLPVVLGRIAGVAVEEPPRYLLGRYIEPGRPDAIIDWLNTAALRHDTSDLVVSSDMLAYGGLTASRVPGPSYADASLRLMELTHLRAEHPRLWIGAFGTIMRLAPTAVPAGTDYFAPYPVWQYVQDYGNLHDPLLPSEQADADRLRALIGPATLSAYLATRARNLAVDAFLLQLTHAGTIDRLVIGQDDAGPVGLHVKEVRLLQRELASYALQEKASIEPGADELGMALVARAIVRNAKWKPRVAVRYSTPDGAAFQDPREYAPIDTTIRSLIRLCGATPDSDRPDIELYVRIPKTNIAQDDAFVAQMVSSIAAHRSVALADLSYLDSYSAQAAFAQRILRSGLATGLDAYSSWNTDANTVGTALSEAMAAGAGRRTGTYNALAHRTFTFVRFLDDYAFHDEVRPELDAMLRAQGVTDATLLPTNVAAALEQRDSALIWRYAGPILAELYPGYHIAALSISLPWGRTFETAIDASLAPNL